mmetsp:Transcript_26330/g.57760  ORF Transcript_26330/g.57760 Transcript_26330/m.57760 type:complete len:187 (+) Transcript_26330:159-719(+)
MNEQEESARPTPTSPGEDDEAVILPVKVTVSSEESIANDELRWPEEPGSAPLPILSYRRWTFCYMGRVLKRGAQQVLTDGTHLTQQDLYRVPSTMETSYLDTKFQTVYEEEKGNLLRTLWRLAAPTFVPAGFCQLLTVIAQIAIPLLVRELLIILEENPYQNVVSQGMLYVVLIFVASVLNALGTH